MPSPFPGMNPFLEHPDVWEDFHERFIVAAAEALELQVGSGYLVKVEVRIYLHESTEGRGRLAGKGDVGISVLQPSAGPTAPSGSILTAPMELEFPQVEEERYTWLEILDRKRRQVVTVVELLSPSNKTPGPDRDDYLRKRNLVLAGPVHFVEIDLRRGGIRPGPPILPPCAYYCLVSRASERPKFGFWPLGLREPLPVLPIPLAEADDPVRLDLKAVLDRVHDGAGYAKYVYDAPPQPPLAQEDDAWARDLLAAPG